MAREVLLTDGAIIVGDFGLPGPNARHRLEGRDMVREFFEPAVPFSPGYGRRRGRES